MTDREYKRSPEGCPHCGEHHEVYVAATDEIVTLLPMEGGVSWAADYPYDEGYQYYYKKCPNTDASEIRVIAKERAPA